MQQIFPKTGGTHAAGLFNRDGQIIHFAEDVGRHNALDKAVGKCLLESQTPADYGLMFSGRVSAEILVKCARAGLELIAAVSAPTSMALELAESLNITVIGFLRDKRMTAFTHSRRITN